jgi:hypothetical protein
MLALPYDRVTRVFTRGVGNGKTSARQSKPITAVSQPPTRDADRHGGRKRQPERQSKVGDQAEHREDSPKYFALHALILNPAARMVLARTRQFPSQN